MSRFSITDFTTAGALCNAMDAASKSDRAARSRGDSEAQESTKPETSRLAAFGKSLLAFFNPIRVHSRKTV